jgi:uncharacterized membrane-anchored protein
MASGSQREGRGAAFLRSTIDIKRNHSNSFVVMRHNAAAKLINKMQPCEAG